MDRGAVSGAWGPSDGRNLTWTGGDAASKEHAISQGRAPGNRSETGVLMLTGLAAAFFYLFAFVAVAAAFMVIAARNPVHSVLYLILTFFNAAALFLLTGAEFLAMILLVVYVGAVAVLFLFVVMMLDVDFAELKRGALQYAPIGALVGIILAAELVIVVGGYTFSPQLATTTAQPMPDPAVRHNTAALGDISTQTTSSSSRSPAWSCSSR